MTFPKDFLWGAATSAYQIEGSVTEDGGGATIWDPFCRRPGTVFQGHTAKVACDHYHRFRDDVRLMKQIGLKSYRFSTSWARVVPTGDGPVNQAGLDFYSALVDELLQAGIEPMTTLFHWEFPLDLYRRGGWLNPKTRSAFERYATAVAKTLGDRVRWWITLNEPQSFVGGHGNGSHAPGLRLDLGTLMTLVHRVVLAHGDAAAAIRSYADPKARVGICPVGIVAVPHQQTPEDIEAARVRTWATGPSAAPEGDTRWLYWNNAGWLDACVHGTYPPELAGIADRHLSSGWDRELREKAPATDYCPWNIYNGKRVTAQTGSPEFVSPTPGEPMTAMNWQLVPESLYWGPRFLYERYNLPVLIAENGISCRDWVALDGKVHDPQRIDFILRYLRQLARAVNEGIPVLGYYYWSLLDNFEWTEGYKERFGLIHVDYSTQTRTLKDSAHWYAEVIASNGDALKADGGTENHRRWTGRQSKSPGL